MGVYVRKQIKNTPVKRRGRSIESWWIYFSLVLGCIIAGGFVSAAGNHFTAVELGYKSADLKRQANGLELEQRKLQLELSRRTAPQQIDERAQKQGLALPSARRTIAVRRGDGNN